MDETEARETIEKMTIEEKLEELSDEDKAYVRGFVDGMEAGKKEEKK